MSDETDEPEEEEPQRLRNPFRSESDAFRLLVIIGVAIAVMVVAAKLGGTWVGVPVAVIVFAIGIRATYRWLRLAIAEREAEGPQPF
jgi:hypothetical protein